MIDFSEIDLVIFDLDGTLIDSAMDLAISLDLAMKEEGLRSLSVDELLQRISVGSKNLLRELVNDDRHAEKRIFEHYIKHYSQRMFDNTKLYPNVLELLDLLQSKTVALVSNKREEPCKIILKYFKIDHHFKMVLGGDSLPLKKPNPAPILHICKELNIAPERTLMIGDSPVDLEAGQMAGAKTIGILEGLTPENVMRKNKANIFLKKVGDIIALLNHPEKA
jgi:phosphoglycolate phosphatase